MRGLALLLMAWPCFADVPPVQPPRPEFLGPMPAVVIAPKVESFPPVHPVQIQNPFLLADHRFYDKPGKVLFGTALALAAADTTVTCLNLASGGHEHALPTQHCPQVSLLLFGQVAAQEGLAYLFHRRGLHGMERGIRFVSIVSNTRGFSYSLRHRSF
jgi:hypothetical protein